MIKAPPSNSEGAGSIPGQGTRIPHATGNVQKVKKKKEFSDPQVLCNQLRVGIHWLWTLFEKFLAVLTGLFITVKSLLCKLLEGRGFDSDVCFSHC